MRIGTTLLLFFAACNDSNGGRTNSTTTSTTGTGGMHDLAVDPTTAGCLDAAKLVYTVDENNKFASFDPATLTFNELGTLNCPSTVGDTPFSMAVDRQAQAWVLYASGKIYKVDTTQNIACSATTFVTGQSGFEQFGMGFAADAVDSNDETLFIAGGSAIDIGSGTSMFGSIGFPNLKVTSHGDVDGWPELTGTGDAKLWGFYPDTTPPKVSQIDKTNGASLMTFPISSLQGLPEAWAFAFWGGDFWIFLKRSTDASTSIYQLKQSDGSVKAVKSNTGRKIVGAGVSTCAPVTVG